MTEERAAQTDQTAAADLPEGWVWTTIGDICFPPQYGWTTSASNDGSLRLLRTTDITSGRVDWESVPFCRDLPPDPDKFLLIDGDIVISRAGSVGYSFLVRHPKDAVFASYLIRFRARDVCNEYLAYYLQSPAYWDAISESKLGIAIPNVNATKLKRIGIPLAPLPEQRRIVAAIEAQFTRLDAATAGLERLAANLKRYRAAVLKAACEGRLVPTEAALAQAEGRAFEDAGTLLGRILDERRRRWAQENPRKKYREPAAPEADALPELPVGWVWATVEQVAAHITSGSRGWARYYSTTGSTFIRAQNINTDRLILDDVAFVELPTSVSVEAARTQVQADDLLITITGANVTKTARVEQVPKDAYVNQHIALIRLICTGVSPYAYVWIVAPAHGRRLLERDAYGAGKPGLNLTNIRELPIALPPLAEQTRIVAEVERRLSVIDALEGAVAANRVRAGRLRQAILKRAFSGRL